MCVRGEELNKDIGTKILKDNAYAITFGNGQESSQ